MSADGKIHIGKLRDGSPLVYDVTSGANFGVTLLGNSGAGKSHAIRQLISSFSQMGTSNFVFDLAGDLGTKEKPIPSLDSSNLFLATFQSNNSTGATINPIRVTEYEGPIVAVQTFLDTCELFKARLGDRQKILIKEALFELYEDYGFDEADTSTWGKKSPRLENLIEKMDSQLKKDKSRIPSLVSMMEDMQRTNVFGDDTLSNIMGAGLASPGSVTRLNIFDLHDSVRAVVISIVLNRLISYSLRSWDGVERKIPRFMAWVDEAKLMRRIDSTHFSPGSKIRSEMRKYGLGIVVGAQMYDHLSKTLINLSTLIIVASVSTPAIKGTSSRLGVNSTVLEQLVSKKTAAVCIDQSNYQIVEMWK